jgi:calcium binding protein 39
MATGRLSSPMKRKALILHFGQFRWASHIFIFCFLVLDALWQTDLFHGLISHMNLLPFEAKKDASHIFNNLVRRDLCEFASGYMSTSSGLEILHQLVISYDNSSTALSCGSMLRECIRYDATALALLNSADLWLFFDRYVHLRNFEVASDSFNTLRELLTTPRNKLLSSQYLFHNYDAVMAHYEVSSPSTYFLAPSSIRPVLLTPILLISQ